jgi:hypothetical protein
MQISPLYKIPTVKLTMFIVTPSDKSCEESEDERVSTIDQKMTCINSQ